MVQADDLAYLRVGHAEALADDAAFVVVRVVVLHFGEREAVLLRVFAEGGLKRLHAHHGAVHLFFGKLAETVHDVAVGHARGLLDRHADHDLGQDGRAGDGAGAAEGLELGIQDLVRLFVDLEEYSEGVAAGHVADLGLRVGVGDLAHVPRVQEIIHDFVVIIPHRYSPYR